MTQKTRLGNYGGPRTIYGSFAGKVELVVALAALGAALLSVTTGDASLSLSSGDASRAPHAEPGTLIIRSNPGSEKA